MAAVESATLLEVPRTIPSYCGAALGLILALSFGCTDRSLVDAGETGELPGPEARPTMGVMYASCESAEDCGENLHCFYPAGESGYCTQDCNTDAFCQQVPGTENNGFCVGVASSEDQVCAIACQGISCPFGMRCESVSVAGGTDSICF